MPTPSSVRVSSSSADLRRHSGAELLPPPDAAPPSALAPRTVHNDSHRSAPTMCTAAPPTGRTVPLAGLPPATLDALADALKAGPIDLDLLQNLLAADFAATPLALLLADELAARCALPDVIDAAGQAGWREVLRAALQLPSLKWEVAATQWRTQLGAAGAQSHPLLKHLRDAAYRPHDMARALWQQRLAAQPDTDAQQLAIDHHRAMLGPRDTTGRHAWAQASLQTLLPDIDDHARQRAMRSIRAQEQRERSLLDPRVGLATLVETGVLPDIDDARDSPLALAAGDAPWVQATVTGGATHALTALLLEAATATTVAAETGVMPLGRYDTFANSLTSVLSFPGQLPGLCRLAANSARAVERVVAGPASVGASAVAAATQGYMPPPGWSARVQVTDCGTSGAPGDALELQRAVRDALIGAPPPSTALARPGGCQQDERNVPGLRVIEAAQIRDFMQRQLPPESDEAAGVAAYQHVLGLKHLPSEKVLSVPDTSRPPAPVPAPATYMGDIPPPALAGALTPHGIPSVPAATGSSVFPAVDGQMFGQLPGHAPLQLLQGLINSIRTPSWWTAIPGYVAHTPQGLRDAMTELFALAGEPLHDRPPTPAALQRFLESPQGKSLFTAIEQMPELAQWQRDEIARGGADSRAYTFMRMLRQLMDHHHVHGHAPATDTQKQADQVALHFLAGIGVAAGGLLSQYSRTSNEPGMAYFERTLRRTRLADAHDPSPPSEALNQQHLRRIRPPHPGCPPVDTADVRRWLVEAPGALLTPDQFGDLSDADLCLAQIAVMLARTLRYAPEDWHRASPDMRQWRALADALAQSDPETPAWETGVGVYFHSVASMLRGWNALSPAADPAAETRSLLRTVQNMVEPLQQLYSAVELPLEVADPHYSTALASYDALRGVMNGMDAPSGQQLARTLCPAGAASMRDGLAEVIDGLLSTHSFPDSTTLPAVWNRIIHGPYALQQWLQSSAGRTACRSWLGPHAAGLDPATLDRWQTCSQLLRDAVLSQLPPRLHKHVPALEDVPALFVHGNAPVLSLAAQLAQHDPSLHRHPEQTLLLAIALLPHDAPAAPARMPLPFPLWPDVAPSHTPLPLHDTDTALLPENWLAGTTSTPSLPPVSPASTHALPALDDLLGRFGLPLLHGKGSSATLHPADAWALISRTQAFADVARQLLRDPDWAGAGTDAGMSPQSLQIRMAQALLERYVGRARVQSLREYFNIPSMVHQTCRALAARVRQTLTTQQPHASAAALDLLQWLLVRELGQPALGVEGIPDWLTPGSLLGSSFEHGVQLMEALLPGSSTRATYSQVSLLAAQLSRPPQHAGDDDALHDAWARTQVWPALRFAVAHGQLPGLSRLDAVSPTQARDALAYLRGAQERHALHVDLLGTAPPRRLDAARQTLTDAGVDPAYWTQRPADLPDGYLARHGIVPWAPLMIEQDALGGPDLPLVGHATNQAVTANDSLEMLMVADAYQSTGGPTTAARFNTLFDIYRQRVESGLAGLIEDLLQSLPQTDRDLLRSGTCTALQVSAFGHAVEQGLLLRCQPPGNAAAIHFEVVPSAGLVRRALLDPRSGEWVDLQAMIDGTTTVVRGERLVPVGGLNVQGHDTPVNMTGPDAMRTLSGEAAQQMWGPHLDEVRKQILEKKTRWEAFWAAQKAFAENLARLTVPFFACGMDIAEHKDATTTVGDCALDTVGALLPAGRFIGGTVVRVMETVGERTLASVMSLGANTGRALVTLAADIAGQSGAVLVFDLTRGTLRLGRQAVSDALRGAGWLRGLFDVEDTLGGTALDLEHRLADGTLTAPMLEGLGKEDATVAIGRVGLQPPALLVAGNGRWYRFDPVEGSAYGPPLEDVGLELPLPAELPTEQVEGGVRIALGDATDARFVERTDGQWEVWIGDDAPYLLDPTDGTLRLREAHGGTPGELQEIDATGCRVRRGVEAALDPQGCGGPQRLRFVPDRALTLPESPSLDDRVHHAFGYRDYALADVLPGRDPSALRELEEEPLDALGSLWGEAVDTVGSDAETPQSLMVHDGRLCQWHAPLSKQGRPLAPRLSPLSADEVDALKLPPQVEYLPILGGEHLHDSRLGLPDTVDAATVQAVNAELPVVRIGPIVAGVQDSRTLRGIRMTVNGVPSIGVEVDRGAYYAAPMPASPDNTALHFTRLRGRQDINAYLRASEGHRLHRENAQASVLRENIARMTFGYMQRTFSEEQRARFPTYQAYVDHYRQRGYPDVLDSYAQKVLTGKREQTRFIQLGRELVPDWKALQSSSLEERQAVADVLNALLPLEGMEQDWITLTGENLADPEIAQHVLKQVTGANFAYVEVHTPQGRRVYYSLSGGTRARRLKVKPPANTPGVTYINASVGETGLPPDPHLASLPVVRHEGDVREIVFDRTGDSENQIIRAVDADLDSADPQRRLDPAQITRFKLVSLLNTCSTCGGVVVPHEVMKLQALGAQATYSVHYLIDYIK